MPAIHIQVNLHVKRWVRVKSCVHAANRQFHSSQNMYADGLL